MLQILSGIRPLPVWKILQLLTELLSVWHFWNWFWTEQEKKDTIHRFAIIASIFQWVIAIPSSSIQAVQSSLLPCLPGRKTDKIVTSPSCFLMQQLNPISVQLSCSGLHFPSAFVSCECCVTLHSWHGVFSKSEKCCCCYYRNWKVLSQIYIYF